MPLDFLWLTAAAAAPAIWASGVEARTAGREDPGHIVIDEVLGQWLALAGASTLNWKSWLGAFLLFRAFDIAKPWPIRKFERFPGGAGIVADDLAAGAAAALVLFGAGCFNLY
jgi:phosphatidylglycerophosphatase A